MSFRHKKETKSAARVPKLELAACHSLYLCKINSLVLPKFDITVECNKQAPAHMYTRTHKQPSSRTRAARRRVPAPSPLLTHVLLAHLAPAPAALLGLESRRVKGLEVDA